MPGCGRVPRVLDVAIALFGVLVILAMAVYHGGSHLDPRAGPYTLGANYLSDLGRAVTYTGRSNALPRTLFAVATILVGGALAWSAPAWRAWDRSGRAVRAADATVLCAVLSGVSFAAVGVVPQDRMLGLHTFVADAAFAWLIAFVGALTVVQFVDHAPRTLRVTNLVVLIVLAGYVLWVLRADLDDPEALRISVVAQKVAVVAALVGVAVQARALAATITAPPVTSVSREGVA